MEMKLQRINTDPTKEQKPEDLPLWQPSKELIKEANLTLYQTWLEREKGLHFNTPFELWDWSVNNLTDFWGSIWDYFEVKSSQPYTTVLLENKMPGARWFCGAKLNYAEHIFRNATDTRPAIVYASEGQPIREVSWNELQSKTAVIAAALRQLGVKPGDRVAAYLPNIPETIITFLACASIGAIWSCCGPDFGITSVIDRFKQIKPKILIAVDGYRYNGKEIDRRPVLAQLQAQLPELKHTVLVSHLYLDLNPDTNVPTSGVISAEPPSSSDDTSTLKEPILSWSHLLELGSSLSEELAFEQLEFDHPLWILYSSGTTGLPKAIVQGHGGILLEGLKTSCLSLNLKSSDAYSWYTTTSWVMWNLQVNALLTGASIFIYTGNPGYPDLTTLWRHAQAAGVTFFGTSPTFINNCMKAGLEPGKDFDLSRIKTVAITGSPLPPAGFNWIYKHVKPDIWLNSISGGTDICSGLVGGCYLLPVYTGELMGIPLGVKAAAYNEKGQEVIEEIGELVITAPMPSMPLFFWNDSEGERYRASYFDTYSGVWRHGDWISFNRQGGAVIYGRSDSTINRRGVRMGSSEIYRVVEALPEVFDSLVLGVELPDGKYYMPLFVVLKEGEALTSELKVQIKRQLAEHISPNHVPDEIIAIKEIPYTLTGKKLEIPVKKLLQGHSVEQVISQDAMLNPGSLQYFIDFAANNAY